jgi:hypothetical protein
MSPEISERSLEEAIECGLLQYGPDACGGDASAVHEAPAPYGDVEMVIILAALLLGIFATLKLSRPRL